jgi:hypothetical protein
LVIGTPRPRAADLEERMRRSDIGELFYIAPVGNVASIAVTGILSHNRAARVAHRSVALNVIQERRERVPVSRTRMLHDHANLYICARNPMMYHVVHNNPINDVCLIRISPEVLDLPEVAVSSTNASRYGVRFDPPTLGLAGLDLATVHEHNWSRPNDEVESYRRKGIKCAEVLVPDAIDPKYLLGAYAPNETVRTALEPVLAGDIRVARYPFFDGRGWH